MAINLDPREVLEHLHELGYSNITPDQLQDFVKDLKKLIKYDTRVLEKQLEEEKKSTLQVPSHYPHRQLSEENLRTAHSRRIDKRCTDTCLDSRPQSQNTGCFEVDSSHKPCHHTKPDSNEDMPPRSIYSATSKENLLPPSRPGFIRPWKYQPGSQKPGTATNRCDPVTLYHKYQAYWRQNKVPGETSHSGLRWNVRERMLGQDPHPQPRPTSRASSLNSMMNKRRVQMR